MNQFAGMVLLVSPLVAMDLYYPAMAADRLTQEELAEMVAGATGGGNNNGNGNVGNNNGNGNSGNNNGNFNAGSGKGNGNSTSNNRNGAVNMLSTSAGPLALTQQAGNRNNLGQIMGWGGFRSFGSYSPNSFGSSGFGPAMNGVPVR